MFVPDKHENQRNVPLRVLILSFVQVHVSADGSGQQWQDLVSVLFAMFKSAAVCTFCHVQGCSGLYFLPCSGVQRSVLFAMFRGAVDLSEI